jgi:serine/threonine protein kinase
MPEIGQTISHFKIVEKLGSGGMGVVYKAHDTRLGRTVALKVLPAGAAADPERRRRFEQEARAVAALNHPHICTLYDIGREGDTDYLVMEFLDGQTLAARLAKGALPRAQALEYAVQIAQALAPCPRRGHRPPRPQARQRDDHGIRREAP